MERWTGTPEGTRNESCGRFGKRTPFLRLRTQLHRIRGRTLRTESLDRSNASDLVQVVRTNHERLEPLLFRTQLHRMWAIAFRNGTLENPSQCEGFETKEKERETFCGRLRKRTPFLRWQAQLQIGYEGERSGTNHWKQTPQGTWDKSCGCLLKWTSALWARVQLHRMWDIFYSDFCHGESWRTGLLSDLCFC